MVEDDLLNWLIHGRLNYGVKLVTGPRGWGKSAQLKAFEQWLISHDVPVERVIYLHSEQSPVNRFTTTEQILNFIDLSCHGEEQRGTAVEHPLDFSDKQTNSESCIYVLIQELGSLPAPAETLAALLAVPSYNLFVTASSKQFLASLPKHCLDKVFRFECHPRGLPRETAFSRWNESILNDVLMTNHILDGTVLVRIIRYLSDVLGDPLSLRKIGAIVSPQGKIYSPHTINAYLNILEDAHLVEKCFVYDDFEHIVVKTGYRYFFLDLSLRQEVFGPAPTEEDRRIRLNHAWGLLRSRSDRVYLAPGEHAADFITLDGGEDRSYWRITPSGVEKFDLEA